MLQPGFSVAPTDHIQGDAQAAVTLIEYGDYQCPSCGAAYPVVKQLQRHFGKDLRLVFRNFPLTQAHPQAESAAETAEFSGAHGQFWQAHDALFENQEVLGSMLYDELIRELGLAPAELHLALDEGRYRSRVRADFKGGVRAGVNGTPTFFINGRRHDDDFDFETLAQAIEAYR